MNPAPIAPSADPRSANAEAVQVRCHSFVSEGPSPDHREFVDAWRARLGRTPHANFSMSLEYLDWRVRRGERSHAILLDGDGRRGAAVLRESDGEIVCGFPWRWQIVLESGDPASPHGMTAADAAWFFAQAQRFAGARPLRFYAPHPIGSAIEYRAGRTALIDLRNRSEAELFANLSSSRRNLVRRSRTRGSTVVTDPSPEQRGAFGRVVHDTHARRGRRMSPIPNHEAPEVEWAHPWHWLVVGLQDQEVDCGLGLGRLPGGMVDARTSGATEDARKVGAPSLVWWEAIRHARLSGHTWMNLCGWTVFKQQLGGEVVSIHCALGGGRRWRVSQTVEKLRADGIALAVRARRRAGSVFGGLSSAGRKRH